MLHRWNIFFCIGLNILPHFKKKKKWNFALLMFDNNKKFYDTLISFIKKKVLHYNIVQKLYDIFRNI